MAEQVLVNAQITDAVTQTNVKVLGEAPAEAVGRAIQARAHAVGRAGGKKGLGFLLAGLAQFAPSLHWCFLHIGGGSLLPSLKRQARRLNIASRIDWLGPSPSRRSSPDTGPPICSSSPAVSLGTATAMACRTSCSRLKARASPVSPRGSRRSPN